MKRETGVDEVALNKQSGAKEMAKLSKWEPLVAERGILPVVEEEDDEVTDGERS